MSRLRYIAASLLLLPVVIASSSSRAYAADDNLKFVRAAQAATALVVLPHDKGSATSFCIDPAGYFITNAHVVADETAGEPLTLVLRPGELDEKVIKATTVRVDKEDDLAILKAEGVEKLSALPLGSSAELVETQQVIALGYPFGKALSFEKASYPSVSVNVARISSMRKSKGKLELIQLDSQLNPGNSGGPVIDSDGKVIGVVRSGVLAAGINFAIPVNQLAALLEKPELQFKLPTIAENQRHKPVDITVRPVMFGRSAPADLSVEVILSTPKGGERSVPATQKEKGTYVASIVPVPERAGPTQLPVDITFSDGMMRCAVEDAGFKLDRRILSLSGVSRIDVKDGQATVVLRDGSSITGKDLALPKLSVNFGSYAMKIDPAQATSLVVYEPPAESGEVACRVVARVKGAIVAEVKGVLIAGNGEDTTTAAKRPEVPAGAAAAPAASAVAAASAPKAPSAPKAAAAAPPPLPAGPLPGGNGKWIDLVNRIDLKRDSDGGSWKMEDGVFTNTQPGGERKTARLTVPVMPTGNYEFEFTFNRIKGGQDLCVNFPAGGHGAQLWLGAFTGQSSYLCGPGEAKARNDLVRIINEQPQVVLLTVTSEDGEANVEVKLNGVQYLTWKGKVSALQVDGARATRDGRTLGLAVYESTTVEFSKLRVRALTGTVAPYVLGQ